MESFGQVLWYFVLVTLNFQLKTRPLVQWPLHIDHKEPVDLKKCIRLAKALVVEAVQGIVDKAGFFTWYPDADPSSLVVDKVWFHVERAVKELGDIRMCIETTLNELIQAKNLTVAREGAVLPGPVQETWMSDGLIPLELGDALVRQVNEVVKTTAPNDATMECPIDKIPQVVAVVDPTHYIHVAGRSRNVPSTVTPDPSRSISVVERAQWAALNATETTKARKFEKYRRLPTDFAIDDNGRVTVLSYIKNLYPIKNAAMYQSIASIFERFVQLFDRLLSAVANDSPSSTLDTRHLLSDQQEKNHKAGYLPKYHISWRILYISRHKYRACGSIWRLLL